jgi:dienelactone hydrolase
VRPKVCAAVLAVLTSGCVTSPDTLDKVWNWANVAIPTAAGDDPSCTDATYRVGDERGRECVSKVNGSRPLVIFLHGCAGFSYQSHYVELFRKLGYVVVAPDSLVRGRAPVCPTDIQTVALRIEEVQAVLERTRAWAWVDRSRIALAGFSEGAVATALYDGKEFKARMIFGWTCTSGNFAWVGVRGSEATLAIVSESDPWHVGANVGDCGPYLRDSRSKSVVLKTPGHDVLGTSPADVTREVGEFLRSALK